MDCPVNGCTAQHSIEHVMCARCWRKVPRDAARRVYRAWGDRRRFPGDQRRIEEHEQAKAAAIAAVERLAA